MEGLSNAYVLGPDKFPARHKTEEADIYANLPDVVFTEQGLVVAYDVLMPLAESLLASKNPIEQAQGIELRRRMGFKPDSHIGDGR
jgi:hypothetical protein